MTAARGDGPAGVELEAWRGPQGLRASLPLWREVLAARPLDPLCNAPEWTIAHAEAFSPPESVFGWRARAVDGTPLAFLPFRLEPPRGRLALRRALLVADGTWDSDYLDLPIAPGREEAVLAALLEAFRRRGDVQALVLNPVPADSPVLAALRPLLRARRLPARERPVECSVAALPGDFEAYVAGLKPRMRSKVRQAVRTAEGEEARFTWCDDEASLPVHLEGLFRLHARRWREAGEPGAFADPRRRAFYEAFARAALADGSLRFARLEQRGEPVAYQFGAVAEGTYYQMQEGYDPGFARGRVATALRALAVRTLIDEGVRSYDFMAGPSRHKRDWGGAPRLCTSLAFALPRLRGRIAYAARALVDRWRGDAARAPARDGVPDPS